MRLTRARRGVLALLALAIALFLVLVGGVFSFNASDGAPNSAGLAHAVLWIAIGGLAVSVFLVGALLGEEDSVARAAFRALLLVDAAWLLIVLWLASQ